MKATPKTDALTALKESYSARYWEMQLGGEMSHGEIESALAGEGCPTADEIEAAFFEETGMSFEAAGEREQGKRELEAEARYDERFCR